ncbi:MAG: TlyA family RNA methyltransferase [Bifidobacteriaceae bacterium]|jgi:23S rRNA (cytidine1920-2'-O)/16S rRNA (cytidine1409-2'-O)-methyltransferase|nr:TlyA family RNA methyltransferase [Bifidobacteriaceae bacterium]
MRRRLDAELVRRHLARSRTQAAALIEAGEVMVDGQVATKPATQVDPAQAVAVVPRGDDPDYASRGAYKLVSALEALGSRAPHLAQAVALDAGASTGGFTDVLLRRGAALVHAVDVGYGQLDWRLRQDPRVRVYERTNVRYLAAGDIEPRPQVVVADLSFISLTQVLPALVAVADPAVTMLLMVKPQFEVGRQALPAGGVVTDPDARAGAVWQVAAAARDQQLEVVDVAVSGLPGPKGNVEFFLYLASPQALAARPDLAALDKAQVVGAIARETGGAVAA